MKKIIAAIIFVVMFASLSYGAVSEDSNIYVRQDVFDAKMEALFSRLHAEIADMKMELKGEIQELRGDFKALSERMDGNIAALSERIDGNNTALSGRIEGMDYKIDVLQTVVYWGLGILTMVLSLVGIIPMLAKALKDFRAPSFTLDDVRALIEEAKLSNRPQI